jgi:hypothetical protein
MKNLYLYKLEKLLNGLDANSKTQLETVLHELIIKYEFIGTFNLLKQLIGAEVSPLSQTHRGIYMDQIIQRFLLEYQDYSQESFVKPLEVLLQLRNQSACAHTLLHEMFDQTLWINELCDWFEAVKNNDSSLLNNVHNINAKEIRFLSKFMAFVSLRKFFPWVSLNPSKPQGEALEKRSLVYTK